MLLYFIVVPTNDSRAVPEQAQGGFQFHGSGTPVTPGDIAAGDSGLAKVLKAAKLPNFPAKTFGEAVDGYRYFSRKEWKETAATRGKIYVDFTGWFKTGLFDFKSLKNGISAQGISIKFLVTPDGTYGVVMVSRIELKTDGNIYSTPIPDISGYLKKLYSNEEIKF
jgi:hypothetical protein